MGWKCAKKTSDMNEKSAAAEAARRQDLDDAIWDGRGVIHTPDGVRVGEDGDW